MSDDVRQNIGAALTGFLTQEQVTTLIDEVLASTKSTFADFKCKACGKQQRQSVKIADTNAVVAGIKILAEQAWGRPSEQDKTGGGITFIRTVVPPIITCVEDDPAILAKTRHIECPDGTVLVSDRTTL
jgi:hypothetical protein